MSVNNDRTSRISGLTPFSCGIRRRRHFDVPITPKLLTERLITAEAAFESNAKMILRFRGNPNFDMREGAEVVDASIKEIETIQKLAQYHLMKLERNKIFKEYSLFFTAGVTMTTIISGFFKYLLKSELVQDNSSAENIITKTDVVIVGLGGLFGVISCCIGYKLKKEIELEAPWEKVDMQAKNFLKMAPIICASIFESTDITAENLLTIANPLMVRSGSMRRSVSVDQLSPKSRKVRKVQKRQLLQKMKAPIRFYKVSENELSRLSKIVHHSARGVYAIDIKESKEKGEKIQTDDDEENFAPSLNMRSDEGTLSYSIPDSPRDAVLFTERPSSALDVDEKKSEAKQAV